MPNRMDSLISRGMGKVRAVRARMRGLAGVFKTLSEQHGEVLGLIERLKGHTDRRRELWPIIRVELLSHERAEMLEVYPVLRSRLELRALADRHDEQAADLEELIERLDLIDLESAEWGVLFDELAARVSAHATDEETQIFPAGQKVLGDARAEDIDEKFRAAKAAIMKAV
jgi:hemerythrin superfamily protein